LERLLLLKLYGSMSWSRCRECGKYVLETIYEAEAENAIMGHRKCVGCGGARRNAVFVPLVGEKIPKDPALRAIWSKAEKALSESQHIVFAGFSLHPDDRSISDLLRQAYSPSQTSRITVVLRRRDPEVRRRYRAIYGDDRVETYDQ